MRLFGAGYVNVVRNTPLTLVLVFFGFAAPKLDIPIDYFPAACLGPGAVHRGVRLRGRSLRHQHRPEGQAEAARAIGLTFTKVLSVVVLPQALRASIPPLVSVLIALLKNTTIATAVNVAQAGSLPDYLSERGANQLFVNTWIAIIFVALVAPLAFAQRVADVARRCCDELVHGAVRRARPGARRRHLALGVVTSVVLVALLAVVVWRLVATDQFSAARVAQFQYAEIQRELLHGYLATLKAAAIASVLALVLGAVLASGRLSDHRLLRLPSTTMVEFFRAVPLLILMFFFYYGSLEYGLGLSPMWAVILGLMLYNGSVLAEIFRAGIVAVPRGQSEAAYAVGLRKGQVMRLVLLPQAVRTMLPAIISQLVVLLKDTALGFILTYNELLYVGKQIGGRGAFDFPYVLTYLVVAAIYIATCVVLSLVASWLEKRSRRSRKTVTTALLPDAGAPAT